MASEWNQFKDVFVGIGKEEVDRLQGELTDRHRAVLKEYIEYKAAMIVAEHSGHNSTAAVATLHAIEGDLKSVAASIVERSIERTLKEAIKKAGVFLGAFGVGLSQGAVRSLMGGLLP